jgi:ABC-type uncharacterized transport system involved in gliding motility auxiliary subunit
MFILKWSLFLAIILMINVIVSWKPVRKDFTEGKLYTLAKGTTKLLNGLERDVTIRFYTSDTSHRMPPKLLRYSKRIRDLLNDFKRKHIIVEIINPNDSIELSKQANDDGIKATSLVDGTSLYLGMAFSSGKKKVNIPFLFQEKEQLLEYEVSRAIALVAQKKVLTIGVMSPFYVLGHYPTKKELKVGVEIEPIWYAFEELSHEACLMQLGLNVTSIPKLIDTLILVNPAGITPDAEYAIDQYLLRGGKVIVCIDPRSVFAGIMANKNNDVEQLKRMASKLPRLFKQWGVEYTPSICVSDMNFALREKEKVTYPTILEVNSTGINRTEKATKFLEKMTLCLAGPLHFNNTEGIEKQSLLSTTKKTQLVSSFIANKPSTLVRVFKSENKKYDLAMLLTGTFKTAFPKKVIRNGGVSQGNKGKVVIISDSDFLMNSVSVQKKEDPYGGKFYVRTNDNIAFLQNIIEQLNNRDYFIESRSRVYSARPFLKLLNIRSKAELEYKNSVLKLEKKFLNEKKGKKSGQNYLTQTERNKILEKKAAELNDAVKVLQIRLRQEENGLKRDLQWFNFLFSPIIVLLLFSFITFMKFISSRKK